MVSSRIFSATTRPRTRDEARRIAAKIAKRTHIGSVSGENHPAQSTRWLFITLSSLARNVLTRFAPQRLQ